MPDVPEIDIGPLLRGGTGAVAVGASIDAACRDVGFFRVVGHGVDPALTDRLDDLGRRFFDQPDSEKREIAMTNGGRAWRGWFPVGAELTAGVPDMKEGLYFGAELGSGHPRVAAGIPMHGPNLFPRYPAGLRSTVLEYLDVMTRLGQTILTGVALGLGLEPIWFSEHLTDDPLILLRIFRYPPMGVGAGPGLSVGEHTDYGLLTILGQDDRGGLQVKTARGWIDVPPRPESFICNLGDMLERLTGGRYRSTLHRVRNPDRRDRLSFPFFYDPSWDAPVRRLPIVKRPTDDVEASRWDDISVHGFEGTYGEYIVAKVGRVFPELAAETIVGAPDLVERAPSKPTSTPAHRSRHCA